MVLESFVLGPNKEVPPPPPLPKYDVHEEASKWNWGRIWRPRTPVDKGDKEWTPTGTQPSSPDDPDWRGVIRNKVIEMPMPEPYKFGQPTPEHYFWFDTPDYADPFKKLWYSGRFFLKAGGLLGITVVMLSKRAPNNFELIKAYFSKVTLPVFSGGLAGSAAVIISANLRGKVDDIYNYIPGGLLGGFIAGRANWRTTFVCCMLGIGFAVLSKHNAEINGTFHPIIPFRISGLGIAGNSAQGGFFTGDLRFGFRGDHGDPGRDVRKVY